MSEKVESLRGKLIVSYQTLSRGPFHSPFIMGRMALVAKEGGAYGIRANTKRDIAGIQARIGLPVINTVKRDYEDSKVYITPTIERTNELMRVKPDIVVLNATRNLKPGGRALDEFHKETRKSYPEQLLMVDYPTVEEVLRAGQLEFDLIGTTLAGYMDQSRNLKIESNDFEIIRQTMAKMKHRVTVEGNINTPEKAERVIELGVFSVVVGSIIIRPQSITKSFAETLD